MKRNNKYEGSDEEKEQNSFNIQFKYKKDFKEEFKNNENSNKINFFINSKNEEEKKNSDESDNQTISNNSFNSDNYIENDNSFNEDGEEELNQDNFINDNDNNIENNNQINAIQNNEQINNNIENNENANNINENNNSDPIINISQKSSIYYYNIAKDYYDSEQFRKSLICIAIYSKLVPNNPKALSLKGKIYIKLKMYQESLNNFLKSIKLGDDDNLENIYGCAKAYKELNQFNDALFFYKKALNIEKNAKSYYLYGTCLYSMGKNEEAIVLYDKSISLDENYFLSYYSKGICLSNLNLKEEAIKMYNKAISINNNFIDAYFQKG